MTEENKNEKEEKTTSTGEATVSKEEPKEEVKPETVTAEPTKSASTAETTTDKPPVVPSSAKATEDKKAIEGKEDSPTDDDDIDVDDPRFKEFVAKLGDMSVIDLADLVRVLEKKFGVSASAPVAASGGSVEGEEKDAFTVVLKSFGDQKINVIKAIKEIMGIGLKEAKDLVESAPKPLKENIKKVDAEEMKKKLEDIGASVELQ